MFIGYIAREHGTCLHVRIAHIHCQFNVPFGCAFLPTCDAGPVCEALFLLFSRDLSRGLSRERESGGIFILTPNPNMWKRFESRSVREG